MNKLAIRVTYIQARSCDHCWSGKQKVLHILAIILFLWIVDKITLNIKNSNNRDKHKDKIPLYYTSQLFIDTLPGVKFRNTSTKEIEKNYYFPRYKKKTLVMLKYEQKL